MAFKIPNFYQKTSPLRQEMTHSGNAIPEGTVFYGGEDGQTPMPKTGAEKALTKTKELLKFNNTNINPDLDLDGDGVEEFFYDHRGQKLEIQDEETVNKDFEKLNDETNKYLNVGKYAPGYDAKAEAMKQRLKDLGMDPDLDVSGVYDPAPKDPQKVNWSEAPPLNTQERTQWYIDNNQGLDHTTPPLTVAETEPEPIEEVMTSSAPRARNNRRTRRRDRIIARNEKAELRNKGIKGDVKFGDTTLIDGKYVDQDFQDPNIS
jgi:hypothetical protein